MNSFAAPGRAVVAIATLAFLALLASGTIVAGRIVADNIQGPVDQAALLAPRIIDDYIRAGAARPGLLATRDLRQMGVHAELRPPPARSAQRPDFALDCA